MVTGGSLHPVRWAAIALIAFPILLAVFAGALSVTGHGESSRTFLRVLRYLIAAELAILIVMAGVGAVYQARSARHDLKTYQPPGRLIDVGGYRLHLYCTGEGGPTVVLDFGLDGSYLDWYRVQPEVSKFVRVCSYDRAGYGWSDVGPRPRRPSIMSAELHQLLLNAGEKPPFILVGHSFGSFNALMYAHQYPSEVAGLVLVDGAHPDELLPFRFQKKIWLRIMQFTMPFGLPRWRGWCGSGPAEIAGMKRAVGCRSQVYATHYAQWKAFPQGADEIRNLGSLGDLPLIVISRDPYRASTPDDLISANRETHWSKLQQRLVELSSHASHVVARGSGHSIPVQRPDAVVEAVREMVAQVRNASSSGNSE
jgi:pimeloyl-ACP methyl ester carboxylesterase